MITLPLSGPDDSAKPRMIDFGDGERVLFQLPVLGDPGVPVGIMTAFAMFYDKVLSGRPWTDRETAGTWGYFIQSIADSYPDAVRQMSRMDEAGVQHVVQSWVEESQRLAGFDPKASSS